MADFSVESFFDDRERQREAERDALGRQEPQGRVFDFDVTEDSDIFSGEDLLLAIPRGVEGFGRSVASLIPGVDLDDERLFGRSDTLVGAALESIVQFGLGFIPGLGVAGLAGKTAVAARATAALSASRAGRFTLGALQGSVAGGVADFLAFDGHERNFSSLVETIPALRNPLTEFLATDEEDPEVVGRIKNVLEGFGLGATVGLVVESVRGLKAVRRARTLESSPKALRDAQVGAVDPGRAMEGAREALSLKGRRSPETRPERLLGEGEPPAESPFTSSLDDPAARAETLKRIAPEGEEIPLEALAFRRSQQDRPNPGAHPRPKTEEGRAEQLTNGLDENNENLASFAVTEGGAHALRAVEDLNHFGLKNKPLPNEASIQQAHAQAAAVLGVSDEEYMLALTSRVRDAADQTRASISTSVAARQILSSLADNEVPLLELAMRGDEEATARLLRLMPLQGELQEEILNLGTARGQALQAQQIKRQEEGPLAQLADELAASFLQGGETGFQETLGMLRAMIERGATKEQAARFFDLQSLTLGRQVYRATHEAFINSWLSSPRTVTVQPLSAGLASIYKPFENMVGGALSGNTRVIRRSMHELVSLAGSVQDAAKAAWYTFKTNRSRIDPGRGLRDDNLAEQTVIRAGLFGTQPGTWAGAAMDFAGKVVGLPSRAIRSADEFSKHLEARAVVHADATLRALDEGLDHAGARRAADEKVKELIVDGQLQTEAIAREKALAEAKATGIKDEAAVERFVEERYLEHFDPASAGSVERAAKAMLEVTQQTPLPEGGPAAAIQTARRGVPVMDFVLPFFRTPVNIAKFVGQRLDIPSAARHIAAKRFGAGLPGLEGTRSRFLQEMMSGDENLKAEAVGRVATGLGLVSMAGMLASSGMITGRGPKNRDEREALMDAGWLPYSFRTPNGYVQFLRMDPFATFFGLAADGFDAMRMNGDDDSDVSQQLADAFLISVANNFTSRSFLQGLGNIIEALEDPERNMGWVVESYASSVVPNGLNQAVALFGDDALKETHGIMERLVSRTPGLSEDAAPRRNLLGEVIDRSPAVFEDQLGAFYGMFVPIAYREVSSDHIRRELAELQHGFRPPRTQLGGIDLREIRSERGQSAHDRWAELHGKVKVQGKTLRQELSSLIRSAAYRRTSGQTSVSGPSPRVRLVQSVITRFRDAAFDQTLREFPELARELSLREQSRGQRRQGLRALRLR